jgi:hypothetical protein
MINPRFDKESTTGVAEPETRMQLAALNNSGRRMAKMVVATDVRFSAIR